MPEDFELIREWMLSIADHGHDPRLAFEALNRIQGDRGTLRARVAELEADRERAWTHYAECAGTPLMADVMGERDTLRARVAELEVLIDQKERCQCADAEACAFVRRIEELEGVLARVRCCEAACCPQCAAEIAALNIPEGP